MAHLSPLTNDQVDQELRDMFKHYERTRGFCPNSVRTMARRPDISKTFGKLNQVILYEGTVSSELKMLVALASSFAAGCRYCQSHMANLSSIYQASDAKIAAIWEFESSDCFSEAERVAIRLGLKAGRVPNQATAEDFSELKKHFNESEIVEIVATISLFGFLNRWNDTLATQLEPLAAEVAENKIGPQGWEVGKHI